MSRPAWRQGSIRWVALVAWMGAAVAPASEPRVRSFVDTESAGWAYKKSDEAYVIETERCRIQWNATEMKEGTARRQLSVRRGCKLPFAEQIALHRAVLKAIAAKHRIAEFDTLSWGAFASWEDWSWNVPIAKASAESADFRDYRRNYPRSRVTDLNTLFVQLADQTDAYRALRQLFGEFGTDVRLQSVEKVFVVDAGRAPFYPALQQDGVGAKTRIIYDVAFSYFRIRK